jgi:hypothetical protein
MMDSIRDLRRRGFAVILGVGIVLGFVLCAGMIAARFVEWYTAAASSQTARMWVDRPEGSPGDTLHVEVASRGGLKTRIAALRVHAGSSEVQGHGRAAWGETLPQEGGNEDRVEVELTIPRDASPGTVLPVVAELEVIVAVEQGRSSFTIDVRREIIAVPVEVVTPGVATWRRVKRMVVAMCALFLFVGVAWAFGRRTTTESRAGVRATIIVPLIALIPIAALGFVAFARPLARAIGCDAQWIEAALVVPWLVVPALAFLAGRRTARRAASLPSARARA